MAKLDLNTKLAPIPDALRVALSEPRPAKRVTALNLVASRLWAITPDALQTICSIASRENESVEAVAAKLGRPLQNTRTVSVRGSTAVIPVIGPIFRYANLFTDVSGATSLDVLATDFAAAVNDPAIKSIVLDLNSPGGEATGIAELAQMISGASKPVIAYVDGMAASAAYWLAAAADQIIVSKTGMVGSIGAVIGIDTAAQDGFVEIVSSQSPKKRVDAGTPEGRQQIQTRIDALAQVFIEDVAAYRGVNVESVLADFGQGDLRMGAEAVSLNMADGVSTLEQVLAGLAGETTGVTKKVSTPSGQPAASIKPAITRAYLEENHSDVVAGIEAEARAKAHADGVTAERARVKAITSTPLADAYADVVALAIENGDAPEAVQLAILQAEAGARKTALDARKSEAPKPVAESAPVAAVVNTAPMEDRCAAEWQNEPELRAEFGTLESYLAYTRAFENGRVKILNK